jgi:hypothetical protein
MPGRVLQGEVTQEKVRLAISNDHVELIVVTLARLPNEQHPRRDLLESRRGPPHAGSTEVVSRLVFALGGPPADELLATSEAQVTFDGRERGRWRRSAEGRGRSLRRSPEGLWGNDGWWEDATGVVSAMPAKPNKVLKNRRILTSEVAQNQVPASEIPV